jgi:nitrogen regulatory protein PII
MTPVKRIEIVVGAPELDRLTAGLEAVGVAGYTVVRNVAGKGERGERSENELTDVFRNTYVLVACQEEMVPRVVEAVRPFLRRFGGMCLVSDAHWVIH